MTAFFRIKYRSFKEQCFVLWHYYPKNLRFAWIDLLLELSSLLFNPYRICRKRGEIYGETSLRTLETIVQKCQLQPSDLWLELGSGRGRSCFWIAHFIGCRAVGIEKISLFIRIAQTLAKFSSKTYFIHQEWHTTDFAQASCVYLYSTCIPEEEMAALVEKMRALPKGAKVVTISAPLPASDAFTLRDTFPVEFLWGKTDAFLHEQLQDKT